MDLKELRVQIDEIDRQMVELFDRRMRIAAGVAAYKKENGLPILDEKRENEVIERNSAFVEDEVLKEYYIDYLKNVMSVSRSYQ